MGTSKIISHHHTFLQDIDIEAIENKIIALKSQLSNVAFAITESSPSFSHQIQYICGKLDKALTQIETFLPTRAKRGLLNPLGTLIKDITGNLDHDDAVRFENAIQVLNNNEKRIADTFNKHITLYKEMTIEQTHIFNDLKTNQDKLEKALSIVFNYTVSENERNKKHMNLVNYFAIFGEKVQDLSNEIDRLEDILAFSRTKSMHHSVLSVSQLQDLINTLKMYYKPAEIISLEIRYYYNIISLGTYFTGKRLVIVLKFPIISTQSFDLYRLCPFPNKDNQVIIPPYPFMASNSFEYVYMEAECPKVNAWYICEQIIGHQLRNQRDCIHRLIHLQEIDESCQPTPISLYKEALTELDDQNYIISFPKRTRVQLICGQEQHRQLEGSYLARVPHNCRIKTPEFTVVNIEDKVKGSPIELIDMPWPTHIKNQPKIKFNFTSIDLAKLQNIQNQIATDPVTVDTANAYLYHTTIPLYVIILFGALALTTIYIVRRRKKYNVNKKCESSTQADIELSVLKPENNRAAAFALDVGK